MSRGRKEKYTATAAAAICEAITEGASLRKACRAAGVKLTTALRWKDDHPGFAEQYARAVEARQNQMEERIQELYELGHEVAQAEENANAKVHAVKLELDSLKWQLSKLQPKRYGERQQMELTGNAEKPLALTIADLPEEERDKISSFWSNKFLTIAIFESKTELEAIEEQLNSGEDAQKTARATVLRSRIKELTEYQKEKAKK